LRPRYVLQWARLTEAVALTASVVTALAVATGLV